MCPPWTEAFWVVLGCPALAGELSHPTDTQGLWLSHAQVAVCASGKAAAATAPQTATLLGHAPVPIPGRIQEFSFQFTCNEIQPRLLPSTKSI